MHKFFRLSLPETELTEGDDIVVNSAAIARVIRDDDCNTVVIFIDGSRVMVSDSFIDVAQTLGC